MTMYADFGNKTAFPAFHSCPYEDDINLTYYTSSDGFVFCPSRHWCLLGEIVDVSHFMRLRLEVKDRDGLVVPVAFYLDGNPAVDVNQYKVGYTVAILYAHQHPFLDLTTGVRLEDEKHIKASFDIFAHLSLILPSGHSMFSATAARSERCGQTCHMPWVWTEARS